MLVITRVSPCRYAVGGGGGGGGGGGAAAAAVVVAVVAVAAAAYASYAHAFIVPFIQPLAVALFAY